MKILVIGSKGFIGSHALNHFREKGNIVFGCDVVVDYVDKQYFLVESGNPFFETPFKSQIFDFCINCSGAANVPDSLQHPLRDFNLNTVNVFYILDAVRNYSPNSKFINLSSAAVYGNPQSLPIRESHAIEPISPYGKHKLMAESICKEFYDFYKIPTCNLRIFSAFGPGLRKQILWDLFQKSKNRKITLFGTGEETRDFIYIEDIIQVIELLMKKGAFEGQCLNVANGIQVKINKLTELVLKELNFKGKTEFQGENRPGDPLYWEADISKILDLGYVQNVTLEEGIKKYIAWVLKNE